MEYVADNYDAFETFENEKARLERLNKKRLIEEYELTSLPFYKDYDD